MKVGGAHFLQIPCAFIGPYFHADKCCTLIHSTQFKPNKMEVVPEQLLHKVMDGSNFLEMFLIIRTQWEPFSCKLQRLKNEPDAEKRPATCEGCSSTNVHWGLQKWVIPHSGFENTMLDVIKWTARRPSMLAYYCGCSLNRSDGLVCKQPPVALWAAVKS